MRAIDLFAGWGGFTLGAQAAGARVVWAANHWPLAVQAHAANHPGVHHECQDLRQADWTRLPAFDLLLAAPACQGHSTASQPRRRAYHDALRATAWAVVDCADVTEPRAIIVENVPSFRRWRLYPHWRQALQTLGYLVSEHEITATAHGVPQRRRRLFIVALRRPGFYWRSPNVREEPAFGPCVEWSGGRWRPLSEASPGARERIALAQRQHGRRCVIQHVSLSTRAKAATGLPLSEPLRTVTTKDQWCVVDGRRYRPLTVRETARAMGFPDSYQWPEEATRRDKITGLGNAVCPPVATALVSSVMGVA